jgi:hypothetical protein
MIPDLLLALASVAVLLSPFVIDVVMRLEPREPRDAPDAPWKTDLMS